MFFIYSEQQAALLAKKQKQIDIFPVFIYETESAYTDCKTYINNCSFVFKYKQTGKS